LIFIAVIVFPLHCAPRANRLPTDLVENGPISYAPEIWLSMECFFTFV
jgi:hypothetical protein